MTDAELTETLELTLLHVRLKQILQENGVQVQDVARTVRHGVQIWSKPNEQGYSLVYYAIVLPKEMREIPDFLVGLPSGWIASEDLRTIERIADNILPEWARYILDIAYMREIEPPTAENGEE